MMIKCTGKMLIRIFILASLLWKCGISVKFVDEYTVSPLFYRQYLYNKYPGVWSTGGMPRVQTCGNTIDLHKNQRKVIKSPLYPGNYFNMARCQWVVQAIEENTLIRFRCPFFRLPRAPLCDETADFLLVESEGIKPLRYCNSDNVEPPDTTTLIVHFWSNERDNYGGFLCTVEAFSNDTQPEEVDSSSHQLPVMGYPPRQVEASYSLKRPTSPTTRTPDCKCGRTPDLVSESFRPKIQEKKVVFSSDDDLNYRDILIPYSAEYWYTNFGNGGLGSYWSDVLYFDRNEPTKYYYAYPKIGQRNVVQNERFSPVNGYHAKYGAYLPPVWFRTGDLARRSTGSKTTGSQKRDSGHTSRVVDGEPAIVHEFPWLVLIQYNENVICGGSLINDRYVLTAAHCILGAFLPTVYLGEHRRSEKTETKATRRLRTTGVIKHEHFDYQTRENDISLIRLATPISLEEEFPLIAPVCSPPKGKSYVGSKAVVAGWGYIDELGVLPTDVVHKAEVTILDLTTCRDLLYEASDGFDFVSVDMLCAGGDGKDACANDSGGPLMVNEGDHWVLVGLVSWGIGCGKNSVPGVYTKVENYLEWIQRNVRTAHTCPS